MSKVRYRLKYIMSKCAIYSKIYHYQYYVQTFFMPFSKNILNHNVYVLQPSIIIIIIIILR